ncbi:50S ribosomal protein L10 [Candidatus Curtissbacteria bacterium]|nr:50S ribosomal protein L10 [Candidatus Curtissbacteria bacterium]
MKKQKTVKAKDIKIEKVKQLTEKISRAKTMAFAAYFGLSVNQLNQIRQKVKEAGGELIVTKNTLLSRALNQNRLPVTVNQLAGATATLFSYEDEIAPLKIIAESNKLHGAPNFKFGFFGKNFLDQLAVEDLAKIPSKNTLQANLVGSLSSPIYGIVSVLQANIRNLVSILDQAAKS